MKILVSSLFFLLLVFIPLKRAEAFTCAARFQVALDEEQWSFDQVNALVCSLTRYVQGLGEVSLAVRAGQVAQLSINTLSFRDFNGKASLTMRPAPWNRVDSPVRMGIAANETAEGLQFMLPVPPLDWIAMLSRPYWLYLKVSNSRSEPVLSLELPTTGFSFLLPEMTDCLVNLLPYNFEQLERTVLYFKPGQDLLDEKQRLKLTHLSRYMEWDGSVIGLTIDGHTDNAGHRLDNLKLSERRAYVVYSFLLSRDVKPTQVLHLRHHGERYPVADNITEAGRNKNRRVVIILKRREGQDSEPLAAGKQQPLPLSVERVESVERIKS